MARRWMTVMDAAEALGVKPAVVRHRIITGEVVSRFGEYGRQVLVGEPGVGDEPGEPGARRRGLRGLTLMSWAAALVTGGVLAGYALHASGSQYDTPRTDERHDADQVNAQPDPYLDAQSPMQ